jgi:hypothetical protein
MAGKWRPFMRQRVQLLRRCFWGMMMQGSLITEGGKERSSQGASKAYMLENALLQQTKHGALTLLLYSFFFFWLSFASSSSFSSYKIGFSKCST